MPVCSDSVKGLPITSAEQILILASEFLITFLTPISNISQSRFFGAWVSWLAYSV